MTRRALTVIALLALVLAACGGDSDEGTDEMFTLPDAPVAVPSDVVDLDDGTEVVTQGILVIDSEARLCEALAESFPPQCAGGSVRLTDLEDNAVVGLQTSDDQAVKWTNYPLAVVGTVEGGDLTGAEIAGAVYEEEADGLKVRLYTAQRPFPADPLRSGEAVWWVIDATNVSGNGIPLTFASGQVAEVTISDGDTELYRWSNGKSFAQEVREIDFEAGRTAGATLSDPLVVNAGTDLTLRAWITGVGADGVIVVTPIDIVQN